MADTPPDPAELAAVQGVATLGGFCLLPGGLGLPLVLLGVVDGASLLGRAFVVAALVIPIGGLGTLLNALRSLPPEASDVVRRGHQAAALFAAVGVVLGGLLALLA